MKNMKKFCFLLNSLLLCAVMMFTGCGRAENETEKKSIRIGVSLYRGDDTFINNIRGELEKCAKAYEQENGVKVNLDIQDAKGSQNTQNDQVERFISLGCDVLCINPVDRTAASVMIDKAMAAGIPVVFFNRQPVEEDMDRWDQLYYIEAVAKESAVLQGGIVVDRYRENPESLDLNGDGVVSYVLLEGESSHQDALIRTEWSVKTLKDGGVPVEKITGGIANWERSQASALMEQWLEKYPGQIELILCNNDDMALGAIDAMDRAGISGICAVGIDGTTPGLEAVANGKLLGTVSSDKERYAGAIFTIAACKAMEQEIPPEIELVEGKYYHCPQQIVVKNQ
ncbi:MAG: galactose ABC transporter substrate-binding protein [Lachnospiraceae bacterium]|nr:galactose ABC transporter substrate-binding protein [Lachnospiraceae bacterium]